MLQFQLDYQINQSCGRPTKQSQTGSSPKNSPCQAHSYPFGDGCFAYSSRISGRINIHYPLVNYKTSSL